MGDMVTGEILRRGGGALVIVKEMEAPQHAHDTLLAADSLGLLDDVADTAVGTARDDEQSLVAPIGQCRIVREIVILPRTSPLPLTDAGSGLEGQLTGDLTEIP